MAATGLIALSLAACSAAPKPDTSPPPETALQFAPLQIKGPRASRAETELCNAMGGAVSPQGRAGYDMCVRPYADAGDVCNDSAACEGRCYADEFTPAGKTAQGTCQMTNIPFGCNTEIKDGVAEPTLCVD